MDKQKFQYEGLKWLLEMQVLDDPQLVNNLKMNVLVTSTSIRDVEFLFFREKRQMLVCVELNWFGRKFKRNQIMVEVKEVLSQLLPSFSIRIVDDPKIMELAIERVKQTLTGGKKNETVNNLSISSSDAVIGNDQQKPAVEAPTIAVTGSTIVDPETDLKKQS